MPRGKEQDNLGLQVPTSSLAKDEEPRPYPKAAGSILNSQAWAYVCVCRTYLDRLVVPLDLLEAEDDLLGRELAEVEVGGEVGEGCRKRGGPTKGPEVRNGS